MLKIIKTENNKIGQIQGKFIDFLKTDKHGDKFSQNLELNEHELGVDLIIMHNGSCIPIANTQNEIYKMEFQKKEDGFYFTANIEKNDIYDKIKTGLLKFTSPGFNVDPDKLQTNSEGRYLINEIQLNEISLVSKPANTNTFVKKEIIDKKEKQKSKTNVDPLWLTRRIINEFK